ncbi:C39 family peptidase [Patescibacteria group bacterium]
MGNPTEKLILKPAEKEPPVTPVSEEVPEEPVEIPATHQLTVPFTSQAPYGNWSQPYQDACEEAAALIVHYYYTEQEFTPALANQELLDLIDFENEYLGFFKDTTAAELAEVITEYWDYDQVEIIDNPSVEDIKQNIAAGRPVIVLAAGRLLGNQNYTAPGPVYHALVITGYDETGFITNDVGTRLGEGYRYPYETIMNAMHDWDEGDITSGAKKVIVIYTN